jgi:hypothetical protein
VLLLAHADDWLEKGCRPTPLTHQLPLSSLNKILMWVPTPYQLVSIIFSILVIGLISYMLHQLLKPQVNDYDDDDDDDNDNQEQESQNAIIRKRKQFNPFNMSNWSRHKTLRFFTLSFAAFS